MPNSGVSYSATLENIFAGQWAGSVFEFLKAPGELQSMIVAAYRAHHRIEGVISYDNYHGKPKGKKRGG